MHKTALAALGPIALALAISACGSSSKSGSGGGGGYSPANGPAGTSASTSGGQSTTGGIGAQPAALITTKHAGKLGLILASGPKKLTVYLFEADRPGHSSCTGACAKVWPPVTGSPKALAGAMSADLGTVTRPDGTKQVTYKGHPLYTYRRDKDDGDTYGEGLRSFGAGWYALSPSGKKVDLS